jgi:hypothetical protein
MIYCSVYMHQFVQSFIVWFNFTTVTESPLISNNLYVLWYISVVRVQYKSSIQPTSCRLVYLVYLITCHDEVLLCFINLEFYCAIHIWQPSYIILQGLSFICNLQIIKYCLIVLWNEWATYLCLRWHLIIMETLIISFQKILYFTLFHLEIMENFHRKINSFGFDQHSRSCC